MFNKQYNYGHGLWTTSKGCIYPYTAGQYYFYENNLGEAQILLTEYITRDDSTDRFRNAAINLALVHTKATEFGKADDLISEVLEEAIQSLTWYCLQRLLSWSPHDSRAPINS